MLRQARFTVHPFTGYFGCDPPRASSRFSPSSARRSPPAHRPPTRRCSAQSATVAASRCPASPSRAGTCLPADSGQWRRAHGSLRFLQLPLGGPYTVTARRIGYAPDGRSGYLLTLGSRIVVDLTLRPAATELQAVLVGRGTLGPASASMGANLRVGAEMIAAFPPLAALHRPHGPRSHHRCAVVAARPAVTSTAFASTARSRATCSARGVRRRPLHALAGGDSRVRGDERGLRRYARPPGRGSVRAATKAGTNECRPRSSRTIVAAG